MLKQLIAKLFEAKKVPMSQQYLNEPVILKSSGLDKFDFYQGVPNIGQFSKEQIKVLDKLVDKGIFKKEKAPWAGRIGAEKIFYRQVKGIAEAWEGGEPAEDQPDEEDCFISDVVHGGYDVSCGGKYIGHYKEWDDALKAVNDWQKKHKFWPNIWTVNDHGNVMPIDSKGKEIK
jgi:hypothetical protein